MDYGEGQTKFRGFVDATRAVVARYLGIRTEWSGLDNAARRIAIYLIFHGDDGVGSRAIFHPSLERGPHRLAKTVRSRPSAAMLHTRDHVKAGEIRGFLTHLRPPSRSTICSPPKTAIKSAHPLSVPKCSVVKPSSLRGNQRSKRLALPWRKAECSPVVIEFNDQLDPALEKAAVASKNAHWHCIPRPLMPFRHDAQVISTFCGGCRFVSS